MNVVHKTIPSKIFLVIALILNNFSVLITNANVAQIIDGIKLSKNVNISVVLKI
jgi:hypothetical protein